MGFFPAAMLAYIVRLVSHSGDISLFDAVQDSIGAMQRLFPQAQSLPAFLDQIRLAVELAGKDRSDLDAIHALGPGWCGDDALAVAVYCALKYQDDFDRALRASVNHGGDSDSTGAVTGNILGAALGLSRIPEKYTEHLELLDVIREIATDLYEDCQLNAYKIPDNPRDIAWKEKYAEVTYTGASRD